MAKATRMKWNNKAFRELRKSRPIMSDLIRRGGAIAAAAGAGYEAIPFTGKNRARVSVITATAEARLDNGRNNTLVRAVNAGSD